MSNPVLAEFRYRLKLVGSALVLIVVCLGVAVCLYFAVVPPLKLVRIKGIELSPGQSQFIMGGMAAVATFFVILTAKETLSGLLNCSRIVLTADAILLPKPDSWGNASTGNDEMELRYADIVSAKVVPFVAREMKLQIVHSGGQVGLPKEHV